MIKISAVYLLSGSAQAKRDGALSCWVSQSSGCYGFSTLHIVSSTCRTLPMFLLSQTVCSSPLAPIGKTGLPGVTRIIGTYTQSGHGAAQDLPGLPFNS